MIVLIILVCWLVTCAVLAMIARRVDYLSAELFALREAYQRTEAALRKGKVPGV